MLAKAGIIVEYNLHFCSDRNLWLDHGKELLFHPYSKIKALVSNCSRKVEVTLLTCIEQNEAQAKDLTLHLQQIHSEHLS